MFKAKYIRHGNTPVVFPETLVHADVARQLFGPGAIIHGAGFVQIDREGRYVCYGESISLGVKSREDDSDVLNMYLGGQ